MLKSINEEIEMTEKLKTIWISCTLVLLVFAVQTASAQHVEPDEHGFIVGQPQDFVNPEGGRSVQIFGDSSKPGLYVIQITWPPGSGSRPHYHNQARFIWVIKGTWYVATGPESDVYAPDSMTPVEAGTFIYEPPNGHHYDMAKDEEVIVQIMGMGPVVTTSIPQ